MVFDPDIEISTAIPSCRSVLFISGIGRRTARLHPHLLMLDRMRFWEVGFKLSERFEDSAMVLLGLPFYGHSSFGRTFRGIERSGRVTNSVQSSIFKDV